MTMRKIAWLIAAILTLMIAIFAVQNAGLIEYRFLNWTISIRRSVVVGVCLGAGLVIGWLFGASRRRH